MRTGITLALGALALNFSAPAQELRMERTAEGPRLSWQADWPRIAGMKAEFTLESSRELQQWETATLIEAGEVEAGDLIQQQVPPGERASFFRLSRKLTLEPMETPGAEVFGYGKMFRQRLREIGYIPAEALEEMYPAPADFLEGITWDPTTAQFWGEFNADPAEYNAALDPEDPEKRYTDFRLNEAELALFRKNGFVVSERLGARSFAEIYYRIFTDDLPVFVSTDSVLQAWHMSYSRILQDVESDYLRPLLMELLTGMSAELPNLKAKYETEFLSGPLLDADYFLAVALSLLNGARGDPETKQVDSQFGQESRVAATLAAIATESTVLLELFGTCRRMDFSQLKPRGHYEGNWSLETYFSAVMWCGRTDFRVSPPPPDPECPASDGLRELAGAVVLHEALKNSGKIERWREFDEVLRVFVGWADSMNFDQLAEVLHEAGVDSLAGVKEEGAVKLLQAAILTGGAGSQEIRGDLYVSPLGTEQIKLPRSFTVLGQRFTVDSWALSQTVYDSILWQESPEAKLYKVQRRVPSALDVAFTTLANDAVTPLLVDRILKTGGEVFRDGLPYQHHLAAVRQVLDSQAPEAWEDNIYMHWLGALRTLSAPTTSSRYPEAMRTRAWAMKNLNAQLASWTHLRHDTLLYVKQSYTGHTICSYPYGYVEPVPHFWRRLQKAAEGMGELLGSVSGDIYQLGGQRMHTEFLERFGSTMEILAILSEKELREEAFNETEVAFMQDLIEIMDKYDGSRKFNGWYPKLFYMGHNTIDSVHGSDKWDALVADVHSDPPDAQTGDPGCILHQAVGNVHLLMIAVDNGPDKMIFAGPVLSHYEFKEEWPNRKSDDEWKQQIFKGMTPPHPDWTESFLVPRLSP